MSDPQHVEGRARVAGRLWLLVAAALLAIRLFHLGGPLDDPHSWRQCDTAHYSLDFARNGIDLLHPAVCWLGPHRTLVLEFPLPEAMTALLHRAFGADPMWDRIVSLAFFLMAAFYLHAFLRLLVPLRVARIASLAYLAFPLGQFYSRAAVVDFAATALVHGLLYHSMLSIRRRSTAHAAAAAGLGTIGALIKAPYVLPILGPVAVAALAVPGVGTFARLALSFGAPAVAFALWRRHADAVNGTLPDWSFLPGFYRESEAAWWYFGTWSERLRLGEWATIAHRLGHRVATVPGLVLGLVGLLWRGPSAGHAGSGVAGAGPVTYLLAWSATGALYVAVFMPLNAIHDYYQIPLLAPAALAVGLGVDLLWALLPRVRGVPLGAAALAAFLVFSAWWPRAAGYHRVDWLRVEAGAAVAASVPAGEMIVAGDPSSQYSDPRLLVRADRSGWPLAVPDFTPARLDTLAALGARWAVVVEALDPPSSPPPGFLEPMRTGRVALARDGRPLGTLHVFRLDRARLRAAPEGP